MKTMKKSLALAGTLMSLYAGTAFFAGSEPCTESWLPVAHVAGQETWRGDIKSSESVETTSRLGLRLSKAQTAGQDVWREDINEATRDDTMAFNVYIGKPIQACIEDFQKNGWEHAPNESGVFYTIQKNDYIYGIAIRPHKANSSLVGNYSVRFYAKTREMADEMYMQAEKNFAYNFGRPNVKHGTTNATWFLNDSFSVTVEYNEYDARMPLVEHFYPYEVVIKREMGDYRKFFVPTK
ncbi:MAG: hypothetical protein IKH16_00840 [Selenomonadaceae bacterium]|nr:hypothetical protein [Selenomonadaceae bacterium]